MSRTYRKIAHAQVNARRISYVKQRRDTYYCVQELKEEGFSPRARDQKLASQGYLNSWDDYNVSAYKEVKHIDQRTVDFLDEECGETLTPTHCKRLYSYQDYKYHFKRIQNDFISKLKKVKQCQNQLKH